MATYEEIVNLAVRRSLFFPSSEIYASAPAGMYDFGPYGTAIKRKIIETWRKHLVQKEDFLEIDGALIMPEDIFKASGHLGNFNDPIVTLGVESGRFDIDDRKINLVEGYSHFLALVWIGWH